MNSIENTKHFGKPAPTTYDKSIHSNPDCTAWAKLFSETFKEPEESTMIGWFANAMMAMHDHLYQTKTIINKKHLPLEMMFVSREEMLVMPYEELIGLHAQAIAQSVLFGGAHWIKRERDLFEVMMCRYEKDEPKHTIFGEQIDSLH